MPIRGIIMKRLSKSFLRVGGIIDFVLAGSFFIAVIVFGILASPLFTDVLVKGIEEGNITSSIEATPEQAAFAIQLIFLGLAVGFLFVVAFAIVAAIFSFKAVNNYTRKMLITNIVLGSCIGSGFSTAAGILGVIALAREARNESRKAKIKEIE